MDLEELLEINCRMIQNNQLTRSEAIDYARKYDDEFPNNNLKEVLDYLKLSKIDFDTIVDKHQDQKFGSQLTILGN